eukprot:95982_1
MSKWVMSDNTFGLIKRAADKYDDVLIYGSHVTFVTPNQKQISFRPQLTMVHDSLDIQMQLIHTSDVEQIKVHFHVQCKELNGFYVSLHPRWMNVNHYNSWDITLPPLNKMSLELSIMVHNVEQFGLDVDDLSLYLKPITQEIIETKLNIAQKMFQKIVPTYN